MIGLQDALTAKLLRQDRAPVGEAPVKVRVRTCANGFTWNGYTFNAGDSPTMDASVPMAFGVCELDMYPSHAQALAKIIDASAPTDTEVAFAFNDLASDLHGLGVVGDAPSRTEVIEGLAKVNRGEVKGRTDKPYRPAFVASFRAANRRDFPVLASIELVPEEKAAPTGKR